VSADPVSGAKRVAQRVAGTLHHHPRLQYVRLTRQEAEQIIAALTGEAAP